MTKAEPPIVLEMQHVRRRIAGRVVLQDVNLTLRAGEVLTIVGGATGAKNALTRLMSGQQGPDEGRIFRAGPPGPTLSMAMGFNVGGPILRGLEMRAAAYGVDLQWYVDAVAAMMHDPEVLRSPLSELAPNDRLTLLYGSAMLLPCTHYVNQSGPLPAERRARKAVRPIFREARKRAAFINVSKRLKVRETTRNQRFLRLHKGRLLELDEFEQQIADAQAKRADAA